jgi:hypothetical protein
VQYICASLSKLFLLPIRSCTRIRSWSLNLHPLYGIAIVSPTFPHTDPEAGLWILFLLYGTAIVQSISFVIMPLSDYCDPPNPPAPDQIYRYAHLNRFQPLASLQDDDTGLPAAQNANADNRDNPPSPPPRRTSSRRRRTRRLGRTGRQRAARRRARRSSGADRQGTVYIIFIVVSVGDLQ